MPSDFEDGAGMVRVKSFKEAGDKYTKWHPPELRDRAEINKPDKKEGDPESSTDWDPT